MSKKRLILLSGLIALAAFLSWRFVRPMNIFLVSEAFERPVDSSRIPAGLKGLGAEKCGECHKEEYREWSTSIHSQAWTDPYYRVDFVFDGSQQICLNCHIPLDRQQEHKVLGFRDTEKWDPILAPNPDIDPQLQHEGVTCSGCHVRNGTVLGAYGHENKAHPVETMEDSNIICVQCHVVQGERWDTFYRMPPCGAVAVEAVVRYHLLDEARRKRIDYRNEEPIAYDVYRKQLSLSGSKPG